jgi:heme-degrading monooxygenase HmoA
MDEQLLNSAEENQNTLVQSGFTALSKFVIANDMHEEVWQAFRRRPHLVDEAPGFLRMDVLSPMDNRQEIWLITYWTDEASFRLWHHSHKYHQSHKGIPKGLKLVPKSVEIRYFEHVSS